jgi:hypothetical protein
MSGVEWYFEEQKNHGEYDGKLLSRWLAKSTQTGNVWRQVIC